MNRILYANLYRLKKDKCFYIILITMALLAFYLYINYNGWKGLTLLNCTGCENETSFFGYIQFIWLLIPIFICSFIASEYSDGLVQNKIISGQKRKEIYIANLITCIIVNILFILSYIIVISLMELIMVNDIQIPLNHFILLLISSVLSSFVICSIFNFITMIIPNKTTSSIISFSFVVWSMIINNSLQQKLNESTGITQKFYILLTDILPYSHLIQITNLTNRTHILIITSIIILIFINCFGIMCFKNKEIK